MEVEMGVMQPQAKECLEPLEAGRGKWKDSPLEPLEGIWPCHLDFGLLLPEL